MHSTILDRSAREKNTPSTRCLAIGNFLYAYLGSGHTERGLPRRSAIWWRQTARGS